MPSCSFRPSIGRGAGRKRITALSQFPKRFSAAWEKMRSSDRLHGTAIVIWMGRSSIRSAAYVAVAKEHPAESDSKDKEAGN